MAQDQRVEDLLQNAIERLLRQRNRLTGDPLVTIPAGFRQVGSPADL